MAIANEKVKAIQTLTVDLGEIIHSINPVTTKEWTVYEAIVDAHRKLRRADTDSLLQLELPLETKPAKKPKPRKDCPKCEGKGEWADPVAPLGPFHPCNCGAVENIAWEKVKAEWAEELAPAEV